MTFFIYIKKLVSHAKDKEDSKRFLTKANEQISSKLKWLFLYI